MKPIKLEIDASDMLHTASDHELVVWLRARVATNCHCKNTKLLAELETVVKEIDEKIDGKCGVECIE